MSVLESFVKPSLAETAENYDTGHLDFAWHHPEYDRMMANECPLAPSPAVTEAAKAAVAQGNFYPCSDRELREALGQFCGVEPDSILVGHGSGEILDLIVRVLIGTGDEVILPLPGYGYFNRETRLYKGVPVFVPLGEDWSFDVPAILAAVTPKTKLIFLCSPNNPTGNSWTEEQVRDVLDARVPTVMDQAYLECGYSPSFADLVSSYPNLIVTRTMSKGFGLAGLRVGYGIADPWFVKLLQSVRPPFTVSLASLWACLAAVKDPAELERHRLYISGECKRLFSGLQAMPGVVPYPSDGNFVLFDLSGTGASAANVVEEARAERILLRLMTSHGLEDYARVTVGTKEQNDHFLRVLPLVLEKAAAAAPVELA